MRELERSGEFKRDYMRESRGPHRATLSGDLKVVLSRLVADKPLEPRYRDHNLTGIWSGYRECHVKPDLLLIYGNQVDGVLRLVRLGSHSELF